MSRSQGQRVSAKSLRRWALPATGSDKESRGRILVVGGSPGTPGAVMLAGEAALRAGGGKLQIATAGAVAPLVAVATPEAQVLALEPSGGAGTPFGEPVLAAVRGTDVVLVGPGLPEVEEAARVVERVVSALGPDTRLVVDALGTAYLTDNLDGLRGLTERCVVNGNPTELACVLGVEEQEVADDLRGAALEVARRTGAVVLCGGADKIVAEPGGDSWRIEVGGRGLGVSGSGDVQAGIIAGLMARGAEPAQAAVWAAYLHGRAGDRLAESVGPLGFLARDLPAQVPVLLAELER